MADYFLLFDEALFEGQMRPALAESWRRRSFAPCKSLCISLLPQIESFTRQYHIAEGESLAVRAAEGLPFERDLWRALVGELLFVAAREIPEFQTCPDTLACLLEPVAVRQAHRGSRELTFGPTVYRPEACGLNAAEDVQRLSAWLANLDPGRWEPEALATLAGLTPEDRVEELEIAREWFVPLRETFCRACDGAMVIVHEAL